MPLFGTVVVFKQPPSAHKLFLLGILLSLDRSSNLNINEFSCIFLIKYSAKLKIQKFLDFDTNSSKHRFLHRFPSLEEI